MHAFEPQADIKFVQVATGSKIYLEQWRAAPTDRPVAQTIVCIHGLGGTSGVFYPLVKPLLSLLPDACILTYDRAGCGLSPPSDHGDEPLSMLHMLEELEALLTVELPVGPIVLVAHSAGTILAARRLLSSFLAHQRVTHVVFIGGPLDVPTPPSQSQMRLRMADTLEKEGPSVTTDGSLLFLLGKTSMASRPLAVALIRAITLAQDGAAYGAAIRAFDKELSPDSGKIDWRTLQARYKALTIIGDEDLFVAASDAPRYLDQSVVRTIIGVGHSPTVEAPEETAQIIASFMTGA